MLTFGIKDIIDILLVALLLYYIWKLMKQSSAANIFTGVLFFVIGWIIVSRFLEMHLLGSIMDKLVSVGVIGLIVLFQKEIRPLRQKSPAWPEGKQEGYDFLLS